VAGRYWTLLRELAAMAAADARGRYLVCTPDLGGSADLLLNLRGSSQLCMDVLDKPDVVRDAVDAVTGSWRQAFVELHRVVLAQNAGLIHWIGMWSDEPYVILSCDFNYMIGPKEFNDLFLPELARQAAAVGRAVFHLDGPGATRHIDALLEIPELRAVQYVPGAGQESAFPWIDMYRRIQSAGRSLVLQCPIDEVLEVVELLEPEGLLVRPYGSNNVDEVFAAFCRKYA
jgi:hypothetical protein